MSSKSEAVGLENLHIQRLVPASPERVFDAWTNPDKLQKWWGPVGVRCRSAEIDLREGGRYRIANELPDGAILWIAGEYEKIERPHLLIYTWTVETESPTKERVTVLFEQHAQGTNLTVKHERIQSSELRDRHREGWHGCIDGLVGYVSASS